MTGSNRNYEQVLELDNGEAITLRWPGEYVRVQSVSVAGSKITFESNNGDDFQLGLSQMMRFRQMPESLTVLNESGSNYSVTLLFGDGEFTDPELAGTVTIAGQADHLLARTEADQEFSASIVKGAVAAQYSHVQLWNPAGSSVNLAPRIVELQTDSVAGNNLYFTRYATALPTLVGSGQNKNLGGAVSKAELRTTSNASLLGTNMRYMSCTGTYLVNAFNKHSPLRVPPGDSCMLLVGAVNLTTLGSFEWSEIAI